MKKHSIYIVEDMGITRATLKNVLERNDYKVCGSSATAEKAWVEVPELQPDLLLLDINLRGTKTGLWLAEKIRVLLNIPIVFLTAYGSNEMLDKLSDFNPDGYIMKPFNNATLIGTIKFAINNYYSFQSKDTETLKEVVFYNVKTRKGLEKILVNNILYLQSDKNYINIYLEDGTHTTRNKLDDLLADISFENLKKVHRRFAVNITKITNVTNTHVFIDDIEIPTSKSFKNSI